MSVAVQTSFGGGFNYSTAVAEAELRRDGAMLRLSLHGGARWSQMAARGSVNGLGMTFDAGVSLTVTRALLMTATDLLLTVDPAPTLDVLVTSTLTLRVLNLCESSALDGSNLPPCTSGDDVTRALSASIDVLSGGSPPSRPGVPWLRHMGSYETVMLLWDAPVSVGSTPIRSYSWVEFVAGQPVITGDDIPLNPYASSGGGANAANGSQLATEFSGYRRGYGILTGALAALNDAGYATPACYSVSFPACSLSRPACSLSRPACSLYEPSRACRPNSSICVQVL
jgi:hypothetical protein